jgi:hypothetical protein
LQRISYLAPQELAVKAQVRLFIGRDLSQYVADLTPRQMPCQEMVVADADHLGRKQHHHLEPEPDQATTEDEQARCPVASYQPATQRADTAGEQLGMTMLLGYEQCHRIGIVVIDPRNSGAPSLFDNRATARLSELKHGERPRDRRRHLFQARIVRKNARRGPRAARCEKGMPVAPRAV